MTALWTSNDFKKLGWQSTLDWQATGISIDTRTLQKGDLFIALKGPAFDGSDYIDQAFKKGATAVMTDRVIESGSRPIVQVDDTFAALQKIAVAARARSNAKIIAITGSVGKTGTKEMLAAILAVQGRAHFADKSFNNHIGVPLTLARMAADADYAVFEIGMNHAGEITPLVQMVQPHAVIVTTVEDVHLEHFSGRDAIADAKAEIFDGLLPGGTAILPHDNQSFGRLIGHAHECQIGNVLTFGAENASDAQLLKIKLEDDHSIIDTSIMGSHYKYQIGIPGRHIAINSLAALLGVHALGGHVADALAVLARLKPYTGRGERQLLNIDCNQITLIDESYNASPVAMRASLLILKNNTAQRRIVCFGDMLELGPQSAQLHKDLNAMIIDCKIDQVFTCGPLMQNLFDAVQKERQGMHYADSRAMADDLPRHLQNGDVVLVKGSAGSKMQRVVDALIEKNKEFKDAV